eukprot:1160106_1
MEAVVIVIQLCVVNVKVHRAWDSACKKYAKETCSGGGGSDNGGGSDSNTAVCCECESSPSKSNCNKACQSAVSDKDMWCGASAWDSACKKYAKETCSGGGGSDNGGGSDSNTAVCCECESSPSKSNCNKACQSAVSDKDMWCGASAWDSACKKYAKEICSAYKKLDNGGDDSSYYNDDNGGNGGGDSSYYNDDNGGSDSSYYNDNGGGDSSYYYDNNAFTACDGSNNLCFYKDGEGQKEEPQEFKVRACHGEFASYQYVATEYDTVNQTEIRTEHWLHFDYLYDGAAAQWTISRDVITIYGQYVCEERDIVKCSTGKWKVSYMDGDAEMFKIDENAMIAPCQSSESTANDGDEVTQNIVIVLIVLVMAICLIVFGVVICRRRDRTKRKLGDAQMVTMRDDDGCDATNTTKDMTETIEIEKEIEVEMDRDQENLLA